MPSENAFGIEAANDFELFVRSMEVSAVVDKYSFILKEEVA